ncbi:hypothetical protein [Mycobacterium gordonae]|uniref:hypothetical protein n=1 Tax=Mycobacterium gordonae TaxID=1778 RepID=UPI0018D2DB74|nr:hypothetical protein [Mycobacterium gordonae]MCV7004525.1 hypothetical protein [Mycobacterium gordonae]
MTPRSVYYGRGLGTGMNEPVGQHNPGGSGGGRTNPWLGSLAGGLGPSQMFVATLPFP